MAIFVGQGNLLPHYFSDFFIYGPEFLHVIITFIDFKVTFSKMLSYGTPLFISEVVSK